MDVVHDPRDHQLNIDLLSNTAQNSIENTMAGSCTSDSQITDENFVGDNFTDTNKDDLVAFLGNMGNNQDYKGDLEDGEIETDDEDEAIITATTSPKMDAQPKFATSSSGVTYKERTINLNVPISTAIENSCLDNDVLPASQQGNKLRQMEMDDDWAGNIEHAIAAVLKKDGVELTMPKLEKRLGISVDDSDRMDEVKRSRKRKKRNDKDKNKMKRIKYMELEHKLQADDIDEDEMVCVRGGSPILSANIHNMIPHCRHSSSPHSGLYDSEDSYQSSYGSYDSAENQKMSFDEKRQARRIKDRRNRGNNQVTSGSGRPSGIGSKRRNRHDSDGVCIMNMRGHCNDGEECHRSHDARAPRKLELCKFYLMDCCAKKDKCSYMHADFPCKYYYLGMECIYKSDCKFSHGDPLTEQLKYILLKHIETAPKEILGNFRRISRENATNLLNSTHTRLCAEKGIENTNELSSTAAVESVSRKSRSPSDNRGGNSTVKSNQRQSRSPSETKVGNPFATSSLLVTNNEDEENWDAEDWHTSAAQNGVLGANYNNNPVIKGTEKQRKSRWRDLQSIPTNNSGNLQQPAMTCDILSLKNLKGVITPEQIERLENIGIENLEQISQLTVAQLNNVGLTIGQINEIQLNAMNIQKLGLISQSSKTEPSQRTSTNNITPSLSLSSSSYKDDNQSIQDVDMRCLVGVVQASGTNQSILSSSQLTDSSLSIGEQLPQQKDDNNSMKVQNTENIESNTNISVDLSQYLLDSNIKDVHSTNLNDILKDDKGDDEIFNEDEPELLIDESRCAPSEDELEVLSKECFNNFGTKTANTVFTTKGEDDDDWDNDGIIPKAKMEIKTSSILFQTEENQFSEESVNSWQHNNDRFKKSHNSRCQDNGGNERSNIRRKQRRNDSWQEKNDDVWQDTSRSTSWQEKNKIEESWLEKPTNKRSDKCRNSTWHEDKTSCRKESDDSWKPKASSSVFYGSESKCAANFDSTGFSTTKQVYNDKDVYNDGRSGSNNAVGSQYRDPRLGSNNSVSHSSSDKRNSSLDHSQCSDNYSSEWDTEDKLIIKQAETNFRKSELSESLDTQLDVIPTVIRESSPAPKYVRTSIYDGNTIRDDEMNSKCSADDEGRGFLGDRDMRISSFLDSGDIDLRLPFKPVMTNYTPATEIDGSIASHAPISYKVYEILIPKPDYTEIRRSMTATEKTLDPRLRRIFCLKESIKESNAGDSDVLLSPHQLGTSALLGSMSKISDTIDKGGLSESSSGPRMDPRRRKENADMKNQHLLQSKAGGVASTSSPGLGQNVDIRLLLQKSLWYKNLNSKFKIMVNQQLALVSTELKKFHQDPKPDKVFDMQFLVTNQYLQQVLTNLGIFIDGNGQILQLDSECDDPLMRIPTGGQGMMMSPAGIMLDSVSPLVMNMDFMRPQKAAGIGSLNTRYLGPPNILNSFGPRFPGDIRPRLLGVSPPLNTFTPFDNLPSNQFPAATYGVSNAPDDYGIEHQHSTGSLFDHGDIGTAKYYGGPDRSSGNGNRGNRHFRQNTRNNSSDRWSGGVNCNHGPSRNIPGRTRNFDNHGSGGDREINNSIKWSDKSSKQQQRQSPSPPLLQPDIQEEEENWD